MVRTCVPCIGRQTLNHCTTREAQRCFFFFCLFVCGTRASHFCGLSHCGAQAPDVQAQRPWLMGLATPRHVGSSRTGARTCVPCIGRQTLNHRATREARGIFFKFFFFPCNTAKSVCTVDINSLCFMATRCTLDPSQIFYNCICFGKKVCIINLSSLICKNNFLSGYPSTLKNVLLLHFV